MIKIIGSSLIIISSFILGQFLSSKDKYALDDLYSFKKGLTLLRSEISYLRSNLSDAFKKTGENLGVGVKEIFLDFSDALENSGLCNINEIWVQSFNKYKDKLYIDKDIQKQILALGSVLENQDIDAIISNIDLLVGQLETEIEIVIKKNETTKKLYRQLSVLFGCLIVIVLM